MVLHPEYKTEYIVDNDVALLFLEEEFKLDKHIDTICLPKFPDDRDNNYNKQDCVVMGWGRDRVEKEGGQYQQSLKQIPLPIVDNDRCKTLLRAAGSNNFHDSLLCAGGKKDRDACEGDGGGPLVCSHLDDKNRFVLAGLVVGGIGCGKENVPGVYASVTDALCFIHTATKCQVGDKYAKNYDYSGVCDNWLDKRRDIQRRTKVNPVKAILAIDKMKESCGKQ